MSRRSRTRAAAVAAKHVALVPLDEHDEDREDEDESHCFDCGQPWDMCECHEGAECGRWRNGVPRGSQAMTKDVTLPDGHYIIRYNDDGEFGQATGWLYREGGEPCALTGEPIYVWRRLAHLIGCGCRDGECESKPTGCRMAREAATRDPKAM